MPNTPGKKTKAHRASIVSRKSIGKALARENEIQREHHSFDEHFSQLEFLIEKNKQKKRSFSINDIKASYQGT